MTGRLSAVAAVDGGSRGNPGEAGCGVVLTLSTGAREEHAVYLGQTTNNVAEYAGLLAAQERALALGVAELRVQADSELLVKQLRGEYRVKAPHLQPLFHRAKELSARFARCTIRHVRREANRDADRLANQAMDTRESTLPVPAGVR
ncbi:MAG: ribonuclease HI family protein [Thermoanaerobaculaceae bacterium]